MLDKTTEVPQSECLTCHYKTDRATSVFEEAVPRKGDLSICLKCGTVAKYDERLNLVPLTDEEWMNLGNESPLTMSEIRRAQRAIMQMRRDN